MPQDGDKKEKCVGKMDLDKTLACKMNALPISNLLKIQVKLT